MQFDKIVGDIDPNIISAAEKKITDVLLELGTGIENNSLVSKLGGDPLIFSLIVPIVKIATNNIPTMGTNGRELFINPFWVITTNYLGLRLALNHESIHALFMHPQRRSNRDIRLWNIAVDYIANGMVMDDLLIRAVRNGGGEKKVNSTKAKTIMHEQFTRGLGNYCTIKQCQQMFQSPFGRVDGMENWKPEADNEASKEIEFKLFYADPDLTEEMKRPEKIYDLLYKVCPRCPECGKLGMYSPPEQKASQPASSKQNNPSKAQDNGNQNQTKDKQLPNDNPNNHRHSNGAGGRDTNDEKDQSGAGQQPSATPGSGGTTLGKQGSECKTCPELIDIFGFGQTLDTHMDGVEDPQELAKRISNAIETAKAMAGTIPGQLISAIGELSRPRISFPDVIRSALSKSRDGNQKNDYSRWRSRPLFAGLMVPKKKSTIVNAVCLLDTSASMSKEDTALGLSQLMALDDRAEITVIPCDSVVRWNDATKIKRANIEEISKVKISGGGGTILHQFFNEYEKKIAKVSFIIVITDGLLDPKDLVKMNTPNCQVFWLVIGKDDFKAPFGRVLRLTD